MKKVILSILASCAVASADDFTLADGKKVSGTLSRVEPDGLVVMTSDGIEKIKFADLPPDVRSKHGFDSQKAAQFTAALTAAQRENQRRTQSAVQQKRAEDETQRKAEETLTRDAAKARAEKIRDSIPGVGNNASTCLDKLGEQFTHRDDLFDGRDEIRCYRNARFWTQVVFDQHLTAIAMTYRPQSGQFTASQLDDFLTANGTDWKKESSSSARLVSTEGSIATISNDGIEIQSKTRIAHLEDYYSRAGK